mmetsp:Transcript_68198/g.142511  ORF Transcript_68198/g.142511 Transcript_68198/m.142511 type:complete len:207 (-) Transcript_68198:293-913(-)
MTATAEATTRGAMVAATKTTRATIATTGATGIAIGTGVVAVAVVAVTEVLAEIGTGVATTDIRTDGGITTTELMGIIEGGPTDHQGRTRVVADTIADQDLGETVAVVVGLVRRDFGLVAGDRGLLALKREGRWRLEKPVGVLMRGDPPPPRTRRSLRRPPRSPEVDRSPPNSVFRCPTRPWKAARSEQRPRLRKELHSVENRFGKQ